jgi:hypothetical protein
LLQLQGLLLQSQMIFVRAARKAGFGGTFYNVSFVGTQARANELGSQGRGIAVTQVMPFPFDTTTEEIEDFREKAHAYFQTVQALAEQGLEIEVTQADKAASHQIMANGKMPPAKELTCGTILNLEAILTEWDQEVLDVSRRLRNYVTNKLIAETVDPDPRVRLKSLELLGKTAGVGLFADRMDVTVTHRTVEDIETELRKTLELYGGGQVIDVKAKEVPKAVADIDLDEELGRADGPESAE